MRQGKVYEETNTLTQTTKHEFSTINSDLRRRTKTRNESNENQTLHNRMRNGNLRTKSKIQDITTLVKHSRKFLNKYFDRKENTRMLKAEIDNKPIDRRSPIGFHPFLFDYCCHQK